MVSDLINALYPNAIDAGISITVFWNSSLAEIVDMLDSYKRVQAVRTKEKLLEMYQLAEWFSEHMAAKLNENIPIPYPWYKFPDIFSEEQRIFEENKQKQEFEEFKERRRQYYEYKNHQRASTEQ